MARRYTFPKWMEPYRGLILNTGGNDIEELMNRKGVTVHNNVVVMALQITVQDQVMLLKRLKSNGLLNPATAHRLRKKNHGE